MELINKNSSFVSITTLEIAELTGKRHDHILRDCDEQLTKIVGAWGMPKFGDTYTHPQNRQTYRMYRLPKREALILVSGYIVELRANLQNALWLKGVAKDFGNRQRENLLH